MTVQTPNPYSRFQYVTAVFDGANEELVIEHQLFPDDAEAVHYQVVTADRACRIYHDQSATRKRWPNGSVILKSDTALASVTLLLSLPTET